MRRVGLGLLVALTIGVVASVVSGQTATRMFATLPGNLTTGVSTPVTCTQSGSGCYLDVSIAGGTAGFADGTSANPSIAFAAAPTTGFYRTSGDSIGLSTGGSPRMRFSGTGSLLLTGGIFVASTGADLSTGTPLFSPTAPTISSGFGTSPSIVSSNGSITFRINVGTGGVATSGVVGLPTAPSGWNCIVQDMTNNTATRQTASTTTTATFTAAAAWAASDILVAQCIAY